jgi:hypothetical protein
MQPASGPDYVRDYFGSNQPDSGLSSGTSSSSATSGDASSGLPSFPDIWQGVDLVGDPYSNSSKMLRHTHVQLQRHLAGTLGQMSKALPQRCQMQGITSWYCTGTYGFP